MLAAAEFLANHIHEAPVGIVPCLQGATPTRTSGSSIYPAVQNMLLAARALGLGATLTTLYLQFEKEAEAALGLPPSRQGTIQTGASWMCAARYSAALSSRRNRSRLGSAGASW